MWRRSPAWCTESACRSGRLQCIHGNAMGESVRIDRCNNVGHFRSMAKARLPSPIFHYIDGAADDEVTYRRNTEAYERCDLVPNVLAGIKSIDMSITVMGQK